MSTTRRMNGVDYLIPDQGDTFIWGIDLSGWVGATSNGTLQKTGGTFALTADSDFGPNYGLKSLYFAGRGTNATTGLVRLANTDTISFRNAANTGNNTLGMSTDALSYSSTFVANKIVSSYDNSVAAIGQPGDLITRRSTTTGVVYFGDSTSTYLYFDGTNFTLNGGGTFFVSGQVSAPSFNATSTKTAKKAIKPLRKAYTKKFEALKPVEYDRKGAGHEFGFIAEDMELIYPEVVGKDQNGKPTGIDYGKLSTILVSKVQEQQKAINKLIAKVAALEKTR